MLYATGTLVKAESVPPATYGEGTANQRTEPAHVRLHVLVEGDQPELLRIKIDPQDVGLARQAVETNPGTPVSVGVNVRAFAGRSGPALAYRATELHAESPRAAKAS